jgi:hypothetical protein
MNYILENVLYEKNEAQSLFTLCVPSEQKWQNFLQYRQM